jgi:type IV pilus assembly protein PilA
MKKTFQKGFTLIELLVVIAIIGILSSIVLASLSSARTKGEDSAIQATLSNMRAQAELYNSNNGGYGAQTALCSAGMFAATGTGGLSNLVTAAQAKTTVVCDATGGTAASSSAWVVSGLLKTSGAFCVDSAGNAIASTSNPNATATACK